MIGNFEYKDDIRISDEYCKLYDIFGELTENLFFSKMFPRKIYFLSAKLYKSKKANILNFILYYRLWILPCC